MLPDLHGMEVLDLLEKQPDAHVRCLEGLTLTDQAQRLQSGNPNSAIEKLQKAEKCFQGIPEAVALLGIAQAELATAYGNLTQYETSAQYARKALASLSGITRFPLTLSMTHMGLGLSLYKLGDPDSGHREFDEARRWIAVVPDGQDRLALINRNEAVVKAETTKKKSWWRR